MICFSLFEWNFPKPRVSLIISNAVDSLGKKVDNLQASAALIMHNIECALAFTLAFKFAITCTLCIGSGGTERTFYKIIYSECLFTLSANSPPCWQRLFTLTPPTNV